MQFFQLNLPISMVNKLEYLGYKHMTPIQEKSLPYILENKDIIAQAKTGSGKTASFAIGILNKLNIKKFKIQSLIMCPTRELAMQVAQELRSIASFTNNIKVLTLCGGFSFQSQVNSLTHNAHIIVGTPGRILKHIKKNSKLFEEVLTLVLDEADRMLDMGFQDDVYEIISYLPKKRQSLLFSATYDKNISELSNSILNEAIKIKVDTIHSNNNIQHHFYNLMYNAKEDYIKYFLSYFNALSTIIFCNTKLACNDLADDLEEANLDVIVLHGDLDQQDRNETLILFANKSYPILIATDIAARGLDIKDVDLIINLDLPNTNDNYIHRAGRTARAGTDGTVVSLIRNREKYLELINELGIENNLKEINIKKNFKYNLFKSLYSTIFIKGGKKNKLRIKDILGALTVGVGLSNSDIGKIDILDFCSYVAVKKQFEQKAFHGLSNGKIKGKRFRIFLK